MDTSRRQQTCNALLAIGLLAANASADPNASLDFDLIALSGQLAPGIVPATPWVGFGRPVINDAGDVAFEGLLDRALVGPDADVGLWLIESDGQMRLIVQEADEGDFQRLFAPRLAGDGRVLFRAIDESDVETLWRWQDDVLARLAGIGDVLPPYGDTAPVDRLSRPLVFPEGASFHGYFYDEATASYPIWTTRTGSLELLLPQGTQLPGALLSDPRVIDIAADASGRHAFSIRSVLDSGVWREAPRGDELVVVSGQPDPADPDFVFGNSGFGAVAATQNTTAFYGTVVEADANDPQRFQGVWVDTPTGLVRAAREQATAPGVGAGEFSFVGRPQLTSSGALTFTAALAAGTDINESNNAGVWRGEPDDLHVVIREGETIPGLPADVVIRDFQTIAVNEHFAAAYVTLFGYTVGDNDRALLLVDEEGDTHLIARVGEKFDVAGDGSDVRSIRSIGILPADPERGRLSVNYAGAVAFMLEFFDGTSGVFTARLVAPCVGDIDGDGVTGQGDLGLLLATYELDPDDPLFNGDADLNGDGFVGQPDLGMLLADYECGTR